MSPWSGVVSFPTMSSGRLLLHTVVRVHPHLGARAAAAGGAGRHAPALLRPLEPVPQVGHVAAMAAVQADREEAPADGQAAHRAAPPGSGRAGRAVDAVGARARAQAASPGYVGPADRVDLRLTSSLGLTSGAARFAGVTQPDPELLLVGIALEELGHLDALDVHAESAQKLRVPPLHGLISLALGGVHKEILCHCCWLRFDRRVGR